MQAGLGKICLAAAFMLAGTSVITGRLLADRLGTFTIQAVSLGIMLAVLFPFYRKSILASVSRLTRRQWMDTLLQALFGMFAYRCFLLYGLRLTSAGEAGILIGVTPAITAILAWSILKEPLYKGAVPGILLTVAGLAFIQGSGGGEDLSLRHAAGNGLILCAAASEAVFNMLAKKRQTRDRSGNAEVPPMVQTYLVSGAAFLFSLLPACLENPLPRLASVGLREWSALAWYGLLVTGLSYALFYQGVKRCDAYVTAAFSGVAPLTSMVLSVWVLKELLVWGQWLGGGMVMLGIGLIGSRSGKGEERLAVSQTESQGNRIAGTDTRMAD